MERASLPVDQIVILVSLCLNSTNFTYKDQFFRQQYGCAVVSTTHQLMTVYTQISLKVLS